jgi:hypothetical protein
MQQLAIKFASMGAMANAEHVQLENEAFSHCVRVRTSTYVHASSIKPPLSGGLIEHDVIKVRQNQLTIMPTVLSALFDNAHETCHLNYQIAHNEAVFIKDQLKANYENICHLIMSYSCGGSQ